MSNVNPANMLEVKDFFRRTIKDVEGKLNPLIVNNPKFEELLFKELSFFYSKTQSIDIEVLVSLDKNSVTITSYNPVVDCRKVEFRGNNKAFLRTIFSLKDDNLVCDFNQGVLFDRKILEKNGIYAILDYESKLEVNYSMRFFDAFGIEYSDNSFTDVYHYDNESVDVNLREQVMSSFHKPLFYEFSLATIPIHVMKASVRNTYRKKDSLGIIHSNIGTATRDGYKDVVGALYSCHTAIPEMLRGKKLFAKTNINSPLFKFLIVDNYAPTLDEAYKKAQDEFKQGVEKSNLKDYSLKTYNEIVKYL